MVLKTLVISKQLYTERGCLDGGMVVEDGIISKIYLRKELPDAFDGEVQDFGDCRVIPGLIELHCHGYKGWSAMSVDVEEIRNLSRSLTTCGITGYLPTNHLRKDVLENCAAIAEVLENGSDGAEILGIHMEGPFISKEILGSVSAEDVCEPDLALMNRFIEAARNHIITVTLAPEIEGNMEMIDYLVENGINVCIGHSNATYEICKEAVDRGAVITQKTGNCMRAIHQREVGVTGAALLDMRLYNEINSDLAHCSKEFLELLYRLKGYQKLCIIADAGYMSGMPCGKYDLPKEKGYEVGTDGLLHTADGTIDGSALHVLNGLKNWVEVLHIPMEEAICMASYNPAVICHCADRKGSLKEGKDADYVVIDENYEAWKTFVKGRLVYDKGQAEVFENPEYLQYQKEVYEG